MGRIITLGPTVLFPLLLQLFSLAADRAAGGDADLVVVRREEYGGGRILDITHAYREDMPTWESDKGAGQFLWLPKSMKNGSLANFSELRMSVPTGTHVDAPGHFFQNYFEAGFDADTLGLQVLNGNHSSGRSKT
uniref:Cyclase-like protein 3 n=1 Tax=Elaeis guineensis var. tenera TaxID=51953 RepID=A0A8N4ERZ4_ELAGV|nr:cyclase-like protein 3 [Elaeis guineensis]